MYTPRTTRCVEVADVAGWKIKAYSITTGEPIGDDVFDAAKDLAASTLGPTSELAIGFLIVHRGEEGVWLLIDGWHGDIIRQRVYRAELDSPLSFVEVEQGGATACVYELEVHQHESKSMIRHVLGDKVDIERYLNDWLTIHVEGEASAPSLPAPDVTIRPLDRSDEVRWRELWAGYQGYYRLDLAAEITDATWERLFDPDEPVFGLGAYDEAGLLVGFTHFVPHRSTMSVEDRCYLHDVYADPDVRSRGIGRALVEAVYAAAEANGCGVVYWLTEHFNGRARRLYDRVGTLTPFIRYNQA